jgi:hypothetical protein
MKIYTTRETIKSIHHKGNYKKIYTTRETIKIYTPQGKL